MLTSNFLFFFSPRNLIDITSILLLLVFTFTGIILIIIREVSNYFVKYFPSSHHLINPTQQKTIIITGCDSGIGLVVAKHVINLGFNVVCTVMEPGRSQGSRELQEMQSNRANGKNIHQVKLDITNDDDIESLIVFLEQLETKQSTKIWCLVNNAGICIYGELDWLLAEQCKRQISINTLGTIQLTFAILPFIIANKGRVINVTSVCDCLAFPGLTVYCASKSAIRSFSETLGYELRKFNCYSITMRLGDFAKLTKIMSTHEENVELMRKNMNEQKIKLYGKYFDDFHQHILKNFGMAGPSSYEESNLFNDFEIAIRKKIPPTTILCDTLNYRIFYTIVEYLPIRVQYFLIDMMIKHVFKFKMPYNELAHQSSVAMMNIINDDKGKQLISGSNLQHKTIIITDCDSGIGLIIAKHLINLDYNVICTVTDIGQSEGSKELEQMQLKHENGRNIHQVKLDITNGDDIESFKVTLKQSEQTKQNSKVWCLINNSAGIYIYSKSDCRLSSKEKIERQIAITNGTIQLTRTVLPFIILNGGRIINVTSVCDSLPFPGLSVYCSSQAAIRCFSKMLGCELRKFNCYSITIRLGDLKVFKYPENLDSNFHSCKNSFIRSSNLLRDVEIAIKKHVPPVTILCDAFRYRIFYTIVEYLPIQIQYYLLDRMKSL